MTEKEMKVAEILENYRKDRELLEQGYAKTISDFSQDPTTVENTYEARKIRLIQKASEALNGCDTKESPTAREEVCMAFYVAHADGSKLTDSERLKIGNDRDFKQVPCFAITEYGQVIIIDTIGKQIEFLDTEDVRVFVRGEVQPTKPQQS